MRNVCLFFSLERERRNDKVDSSRYKLQYKWFNVFNIYVMYPIPANHSAICRHELTRESTHVLYSHEAIIDRCHCSLCAKGKSYCHWWRFVKHWPLFAKFVLLFFFIYLYLIILIIRWYFSFKLIWSKFIYLFYAIHLYFIFVVRLLSKLLLK